MHPRPASLFSALQTGLLPDATDDYKRPARGPWGRLPRHPAMDETSAEWNTFEIDAPTLAHWIKRGEAVLIDVREPEEYQEERIPGSILVPLSSFDPGTLAERYGDRTIVLHCLAGSRAEKAAAMFSLKGHPAPATLRDGLLGWQGAGLPTEGADAPAC